MKIEYTNRGFGKITFIDDYGIKCSIQESSSASEEKIWFGVDDPKLIIFENNSKGKYIETDMPDNFSVDSRMHLTRKQVKDLLPHLINFVESGDIDNVDDGFDKKILENLTGVYLHKYTISGNNILLDTDCGIYKISLSNGELPGFELDATLPSKIKSVVYTNIELIILFENGEEININSENVEEKINITLEC